MSRFNRSIVVEILCSQQSPEDFDFYYVDFLQFRDLSLDILEILGAIVARKELSISQLEHSIGTCISSLEQIRDQSTKVTMATVFAYCVNDRNSGSPCYVVGQTGEGNLQTVYVATKIWSIIRTT